MTAAGVVLDEQVPGWKVVPHRHHHVTVWRQVTRDVHQLVSELNKSFRAVVAVLVALSVETSTVLALVASGHPVWAVWMSLTGGSVIAAGVAIKAMGGIGK